MGEVLRDTVITIGTSPIEVAADLFDNDRIELTLTNTSSAGQVISISVDKEAVAGEGRPLSVGGFICESEDSGYRPSTKRYSAISSAAGGTLAIHERIRVKNGF